MVRKAVLLFCLFYLAFSASALAQELPDAEKQPPGSLYNWDELYRNSFYGELLGNSFFGLSGNYERLFPFESKKKVTVALRAGYGFTTSFFGEIFSEIPTEVTIYGGNRFVKPELGFGLTFIRDSYQDRYASQEVYWGSTGIVRLGVRLQKTGSRGFVRLGVSLWMFGTEPEAGDLFLYPMPGLSVGTSFGRKEMQRK